MNDEDNFPEAENEEGTAGAAGFPPHILAGILGAAVHEGGVHGSVLSQTRDMVEAYMKPETGELISPDGIAAPFVITHNGVNPIAPEAFDAWRARPMHRRGTAVMTDLTSFIGHVNRFKDDNSVIFAKDDPSAPGLTAVLDYNEEGAAGAPRFGKHRTAFNFPVSPEWRAWTGANGNVMSMLDFAKFIEDRYVDIIPPAVVASTFTSEDDPVKKFVDSLGGIGKLGGPADLMRIASGMAVHEKSTVGDVVRLSSGEGSVTFTVKHETTDATGEKMTVPPAFGVAVPVFRGELPFCVIARLRYRKVSGSLNLWCELFRADLTFDTAVNEAIEKVQHETGLTVWKGQPEA